ncbi:MAG TPA: hypothetical protein VN493_15635, partial [Thermoanaerobaculia bacterium]|nr:hypothetical protein [Thermoanaerobaculia bacterium]
MEQSGSRLEATARIIQTVAVVAGIVFGIHEFVIKDRDHDRQLLDLTIQQADRLRSDEVKESQRKLNDFRELAFGTPVSAEDIHMRLKVAEQFQLETRDLAHFYALIHRCTEAGFCNRDLVQVLICEDASKYPPAEPGALEYVSRSKRLEGVANATPHGLSHRSGGSLSPQPELVL